MRSIHDRAIECHTLTCTYPTNLNRCLSDALLRRSYVRAYVRATLVSCWPIFVHTIIMYIYYIDKPKHRSHIRITPQHTHTAVVNDLAWYSCRVQSHSSLGTLDRSTSAPQSYSAVGRMRRYNFNYIIWQFRAYLRPTHEHTHTHADIMRHAARRILAHAGGCQTHDKRTDDVFEIVRVRHRKQTHIHTQTYGDVHGAALLSCLAATRRVSSPIRMICVHSKSINFAVLRCIGFAMLCDDDAWWLA